MRVCVSLISDKEEEERQYIPNRRVRTAAGSDDTWRVRI